VTTDPLVLAAEVDRATDRLLDTARSLDDSAIAGPSLLPNWTRGHVLTHLARNADSLVNLLIWASTGVETPQYPSLEQRDADIEAGAGRSAAEQLKDLTDAAQRFAATAREVPARGWTVQVRWTAGRVGPAAGVMWSRLREVEVHHVDMDAGYASSDWADSFTHRLLHEVAANFADSGLRVHLLAADLGHDLTIGDDRPSVTVSGPGHAIAAWLTGRSTGAGLTVDPDGALPPVPRWK
jgi:maleylpyruvate isomerase